MEKVKTIEDIINQSNENLEELNLLYVACTRARNLLVINGFSDSKYSNSWFANLLSSQ